MAPSRSVSARHAVRAVRSAPAAGFATVAAAAGMRIGDVRAALGSMSARGRCSAAAAALSGHQDRGVRAAGLAYWACPPPVVAAASGSAAVSVTEIFAAAGAASWAARPAAAFEVGDAQIIAQRPGRHRGLLLRVLSQGVPEALEEVADNQGCPRAVIRRICAAGPAGAVVEAAQNPRCPVDELYRLASDERMAVVHAAAASNASAPQRLVERFALRGGVRARTSAASRADRTPDMLDAMLAACGPSDPAVSFDEQPFWTRQAIGSNPNCRPSTLAALAADDGNVRVREAALANPGCPQHVLAHAAVEGSKSERGAVASNPNCPSEILGRLAVDDHFAVRRAAVANPSCSASGAAAAAGDADWLVRAAWVQRGGGSAETLAALADDRDDAVQAYVASVSSCVAMRPDCPEAVLRHLGAGVDGPVRAAVASNLACPRDVLDELAADIDGDVVAKAVSNPGCSLAALTEAAGRSRYTMVSVERGGLEQIADIRALAADTIRGRR